MASWKKTRMLNKIRAETLQVQRSYEGKHEAPDDVEEMVTNRSEWRSDCNNTVQYFESERVTTLEDKRAQRKTGYCQLTRVTSTSKIDLYAYRRALISQPDDDLLVIQDPSY